MPYYTFQDKEGSRPEIVGNWKAQLVAYFRKREKATFKTELPGIALQSAAGQFMASHRMPEKFRPEVIHAIKQYFRMKEHISDPNQPMVTPKRSVGQFEMAFESVIRSALVNENGDSVELQDGTVLDYRDADAVPFIFSKDGTNFLTLKRSSRMVMAHLDLIELVVGQDSYPSHDSLKILRPELQELVVKNLPSEGFVDILQQIDKVNDYKLIYQMTLSGRIWLKRQVLGMWCTPQETKIILPTLQKLFPIGPGWVIDFDATVSGYQPTVEQYLKDFVRVRTRSEQETALLQQQHIEPLIKKLTGAYPGSEHNADVSQKAGYSTPAKFNAQRVVGDSVEHE